MEHFINGFLHGKDYFFTLDLCEPESGDSVNVEVMLDEVTERSFQFVVEHPSALGRRNFFYSEVLEIAAGAGVLKFTIPSSVFTYAGKSYVQIAGGESNALRWTSIHDEAIILCKTGAASGSGDTAGSMLGEIRKTCARVDTALTELEGKTADDFGALPNTGGAVGGDLEIAGALTVGQRAVATELDLEELVGGAPERFDTLKEISDWIDCEEAADAALSTRIDLIDAEVAQRAIAQNVETVSAQDTYSCDYINELHREALDLDPYFVGTAGSIVTVEDTPTGKYLEPDDYKVALPLRQYVSPNLLSAQPIINNQVMTLADFGRDVTMSAIIGFKVENFSIASAAGAVIDFQKADGTHQYRTGGAFGWKVGETYTGVYTNKAENLTFRYVMFYGYNDGYAIMSGTIKNGMMNSGSAILPYEPYTGSPNPSNPIPIESPSKVYAQSVGVNILEFLYDTALTATRGVATVNTSSRTVTLTASAGDCYIDNGFQGTGEIVADKRMYCVPCKPNTTYTFSFRKSVELPTTIHASLANKDYYVTNLSFGNQNWRTLTITTKADTKYIQYRFGVVNAGDTIAFSEIQINEGSAVKPYLPYESETAEIAPRDVNGYAVALSGGVAGAENTIEYKDGKPYYIAKTSSKSYNGTGNWLMGVLSDATKKTVRFYLPQSDYAFNSKRFCNWFPYYSGSPYGKDEELIAAEGTDRSVDIRILKSRIANWDEAWTSAQKSAAFKSFLAEQAALGNPLTVWYPLATPTFTELDPASLPILQTYSPETTFYVSSDVEGLNPSIDLTALNAQNATFAKGMLKLNNGEVLTPLTTADMVLTADGRALDEVLAEMRAALNII